MKRSEAIGQFLQANARPDLSALYHAGMEVQVNVSQGSGERAATDSGIVWTDGLEEWYSFRIPKHAKTDPIDNDHDLHFALPAHCESIGLTGWDWLRRESVWCGYDFDAIVGHTSGLSSDRLHAVQDAACELPYVTVRKSTSGNGLHLYVFLDPATAPTAANHTEHAAVARAILGKMSLDVGFDFGQAVDCYGSVLWIWHRRMAESGFELIREGEPLADVPTNWPDYIAVTSGKRKRTKPSIVSDAQLPDFDVLSGRQDRVPLDNEHRLLLDFLREYGAYHWWDNDHHMIVCHTTALAEAHIQLNLRGHFDTQATGRDRGQDQNCFAFPAADGAWAVRRHTPGARECESWQQDGKTWTKCYLNKHIPFADAAALFGSKPGPKEYHFDSTGARKALAAAGIDCEIPDCKRVIIRVSKGNLIIIASKSGGDRWATTKLTIDGQRRKMSARTIAYTPSPITSNDLEIDDTVRHLMSGGKDCGWVVLSDGVWGAEPAGHIRPLLASRGHKPDMVIGDNVSKPWRVVNTPFGPEYPGDRIWNMSGAQLAYTPKLDGPYDYPTWQRVLSHCGHGLDEVIAADGWCKANRVLTGADYLFLWVASMLQSPERRLPYLFFYGPQRTGKTTFHVALSSLMTRGCALADSATTSTFNGELDGTILCVIEETNLGVHKEAYARVKAMTTAKTLSIHAKYKTPYLAPNYTHWVQTANELDYCPSFEGDDTRIVVSRVPLLTDPIDGHELMRLLDKEAPAFLGAVMSCEIPPSSDPRLGLPIVASDDKAVIRSLNETALDTYLIAHPIAQPVKFADFYRAFITTVDPVEVSAWSKIKTSKTLVKLGYKRYSGANNVVHFRAY